MGTLHIRSVVRQTPLVCIMRGVVVSLRLRLGVGAWLCVYRDTAATNYTTAGGGLLSGCTDVAPAEEKYVPEVSSVECHLCARVWTVVVMTALEYTSYLPHFWGSDFHTLESGLRS